MSISVVDRNAIEKRKVQLFQIKLSSHELLKTVFYYSDDGNVKQ